MGMFNIKGPVEIQFHYQGFWKNPGVKLVLKDTVHCSGGPRNEVLPNPPSSPFHK